MLAEPTTHQERTLARRREGPWPSVLAGGVVAGTLDILYACIFWGVKADVPPSRILQSVAAGLLGEASFTGGTATAGLGLLLHYLIACTMSLAYYLAARRWPGLTRRPLAWGSAYGLVLYVIMNHIVVPLSAAPGGSPDPTWVVLTVAVHAFLVGVPIAWFAGRSAAQRA